MLETEKIRTEKNIDKIVEHIDIFENKMNKTIYATQNDDGTYRVVITNTEFESVIERADIHITAYAEKDGDKILSFTIKE